MALAINSDSVNTKRKVIGFAFAPEYCYRTLTTNDASLKWIVDLRDTIELPRFGFTVGFFFSYDMKKRWCFESGAMLTANGYKYKNIHIVNVNGSFIGIAETFYHYLYFQIPLKVKFYLYNSQNSQFRFFLHNNFMGNIFLERRIKSNLKYDDGKTDIIRDTDKDFYNYNKLNYSWSAGIGVRYILKEKISFQLEPYYKRFILPTVDAPINEFLYSYGVNVGIGYSF